VRKILQICETALLQTIHISHVWGK
jgi:hypothetical protein